MRLVHTDLFKNLFAASALSAGMFFFCAISRG